MSEHLLSRRGFLQGSAATGTLMTTATTLPQARAIEPISRFQKPAFKFSLAAYSYRNLLSGKNPQLTLFDFVDDCARMGLEGTELTSYYFPNNPGNAYLRKLKGHCFRQGLDISGTAVGNDFCHPDKETQQRQIDLVKTWIKRADAIDAPVIRIFSGGVRPGQTQEQARQLAIQAIEECCEYAGQHGILLALENHGGLTATATGMLALVQAVRSPWFGVNLDTGNFHSQDIYGDLARLAPYAVNVQVKVVIKPARGPRQESDFNKLAHILRQAHYRGYIVLEYEEKDDPRKACPALVQQLRQAFTG